ncbi:cytochrome c biogenesis CcdA family protein [Candidatus Margulisiibacteriota bacterium]
MLLNIFEALYASLQAMPAIALTGAFIWGMLSILLSPCHLASIPLIVGFISGREKGSNKEAFFISTVFSAGILTTIAMIGLITGMMGRMFGDIGIYGNYIAAIILFIVGLYLLEIVRFPFLSGLSRPKPKEKGFFAAFILGLSFGAAMGPCTFAYMAPVLGIAFNIAATRFLYAVMLLLFYGIGHCSVIVFAGTFTETVRNYLNWNERSKATLLLRKICGILVIIGGIYLIRNY